MPCSCHFTPSKESLRYIKSHCQAIVDEMKYLNKIGDPIEASLKDIKELIEHLYTGECPEKHLKEKEDNKNTDFTAFKNIFEELVIKCIGTGDQNLWNHLYPHIKKIGYRIDKNILKHFSSKISEKIP